MFDSIFEAKRVVALYKEALTKEVLYDEDQYTTGYLFRKTGVR